MGLLKDHHSHPLLYASFMAGVDLSATHDAADAILNLQTASEKNAHNTSVMLGYGWRDNRFALDSDALKILPPTVVFNLSLHWLVMNDPAREILKSMYGDDVDRIGDPVWYEQNFRTVLNWFAKLNGNAKSLTSFYDSVLLQGVASCEELALVDGSEIDLFQSTGLSDRTRFWSTPDTFASLSDEHQAAVHGLKLFTDGALGSRTAGLHRPFRSKGKSTTNCGMLIYTDEQLEQVVSQCLATGKALAIHAIGDKAIDQTIETLNRFQEQVKTTPEVRIEHAQMISGVAATTAKELGVKLSMQPNFSQDSVDYADRLDPGYCHVNNPFRMLIDRIGFIPGEDLIFGSDGMPHGVQYAIEQSLFPTIDMQRLALHEFVAGYCHTHPSKEIVSQNDTRIPTGEIRLSIDSDNRKVQSEVIIGCSYVGE